LYLHDKPKEPTKEGPLSFVLFASPFTSVSTFSRGHPSLVSLIFIGSGIKALLRHDKQWDLFGNTYKGSSKTKTFL
jgi:hypothetical protein